LIRKQQQQQQQQNNKKKKKKKKKSRKKVPSRRGWPGGPFRRWMIGAVQVIRRGDTQRSLGLFTCVRPEQGRRKKPRDFDTNQNIQEDNDAFHRLDPTNTTNPIV
jgi:hypothetical protein